LSDIIKKLVAKLYAWALPATLILGAYYLLVHRNTTIGHGQFGIVSEPQQFGIFVAIVAAVTFTLSVFSTALYRVLEGYLLWPHWLQRRGVRGQRRRKAMLHRAARSKTIAGWRRGLALEKLALYPKDKHQIVPTRFGNALRSFETYGKTRYNLDSQSLWYELCAVVPKYLQNEIEEVRSSVDFFVALAYLSFLMGIGTLAVGYYEPITQHKPFLFVVGALALALAVLSHWLAVRTTREWGYVVQALVNIGRLKLAESLGLKLPASLQQEKTMWGLVTRYGYFAKSKVGDELNTFRVKL
jgi:hypothetical protein